LIFSRIQPGAGLENKKTNDPTMAPIAEEGDIPDEERHFDITIEEDTGPQEHVPKVELLFGETVVEEQGNILNNKITNLSIVTCLTYFVFPSAPLPTQQVFCPLPVFLLVFKLCKW